MRNGQKPEPDQALARIDDSAVMPAVEVPKLASVKAEAEDDESTMQLGFDSLEEPAEVLIRVSMESLAGTSDLLGDEEEEVEVEPEPEAAVAPEAAVVPEEPTVEPEGRAELDAAEAFEPAADAAVEPEAAVEPDAAVEPEGRAELDSAEAFEPARDAAVIEPVEDAEAAELDVAGVVRSAPPDSLDEETATESIERLIEEAESAMTDESAMAELEDGAVDEGTLEAGAQPELYEPVDALPVDDPSLAIRLARIHLKTGSYSMARAEFEALAARKQLDTAAHLDLAEARWRTGDLHGAGQAAAAYLDDGGDEALGFVIAAEAAGLANRHAEARRHTELALERELFELDPVFAGIPRRAMWVSPVWSAAAAAVIHPEPVALPQPAASSGPAEVRAAQDALPASMAEAPLEPEVAAPEAEPTAGEAEPTAGEAEPTAGEAEVMAPDAGHVPETPGAEPALPPAPAKEVEPPAAVATAGPNAVEANAEVTSGRSFLEAGDPMMAALHFGVAIRLAPESARAVLDAIGERQDLPLQLVRGDTLRILGLKTDADRAYLSVASALGAPKAMPPTMPTTPTAPEPPIAPDQPAAAMPEPAPPPPEPAQEPVQEPMLDDDSSIRWDG